jgi:hypothetical protein
LGRPAQLLAVKDFQAVHRAPAAGEAKLVRSNRWQRDSDFLVE